MNKTIEKEEIVEIAAGLFRMKGYSATSIDDIAKACRLTKGSLYHHFSGKEDLAIAALEQVHGHFSRHIFPIVMESEQPSHKELKAFNAAIESFFAHHPHGCLLANLSLEVGGAYELFSERITRFFADWSDCYTAVFRRSHTEKEAKTLALDALAGVQGCVLMNRIWHNLGPLRRHHALMLQNCLPLRART